MPRPRPTVLPIGEISSGTMRLCDTMPRMIDALRDIRIGAYDRREVHRIAMFVDFAWEDDAAYWTENAEHDIETLETILDTYAPEFAYYGSTEGDGACYGVWPAWESILDAEHDEELIRSEEAPPITRHMGAAYWLQVNDHGNTTLYRRGNGNRWREVWAIV